MRYFKYWARARKDGPSFPVTCWGFSNENTDDAKAMAEKRAEAALEKLAAPRTGGDLSVYYDVDPLKERVVEELTSADGVVVAVVTRNAYGALILNTATVPFLDVDLPPQADGGLVSMWRKLTRAGDDREQRAFDRITATLQEVPELAGRIYRTANGFRVMITSHEFAANSPDIHNLMAALRVDPLYQRLCARQECFRARLTPKPWRIGMRRPPVRYPLVGAYSRTYEAWLGKYETMSRDYRVCRLLATFGAQEPCSAAALLIRLHDSDLAAGDEQLA